MQLLAFLLVPFALMLVVALVSAYQLRARKVQSLGRVAVIAFCANVLLALVLAVVLLRDSGSSRVVFGLSFWLAVLLGGVAFGAIAADRSRRSRILPWHVATGIAVVATTCVVLAEAVAPGIS